ncbi:MAG TPA: 2-oxoacid:acceptor oxidoreductase family protein [Anaerolineales bacterium]|jgi:2-oxoglutarate ferredoxin oxidoreductase subunit gamma|nr:2-oxoacid:acceptor oxidoreductase family protein [Anaerolineales bacterium]
METSIIISGFGGQGTLFAGQLLTYAALDCGKHCTWIPSYGPEMRGGTAHCTVIISEEEIGSPIVRNPDVVLAMNLPSLDKYEPLIKAGGVMIANQSLINREIERNDITTLFIPGNDIAEGLGSSRTTNMVMAGAMLELTSVLPLDAVKNALDQHIPARNRKYLELNYEAMEVGAKFARENIKLTA